MPYSSGRITKPVSFDDVNAALGTKLVDLDKLCVATQVIPWAKYKPETAVTGLVTYGTEPITLANRKLNSFGISIPTSSGYGSVSLLVTALRNGTVPSTFTYVKPSGTLASPYRITDFEDYWPAATAPITFPYNKNDKLEVSSTGSLQLYYYVNIEGSTYGIGLSDLRIQGDSKTLSEYYFGILIYNASTYAAATQTTKMGTAHQDGLSVTIPGVSKTAAKYNMIPFFSTKAFSAAQDASAKTIYPIPFAQSEINTAAQAQYVSISVWGYVWSDKMTTLRFKYSVVNRTSGTFTFNTETYGSSTSYIEVGKSGQANYQRWPVKVYVSIPAGSEKSGEIVLSSSLLTAQANMIMSGNSKVYIRAAQHNGQYTYSDIIQIWEN